MYLVASVTRSFTLGSSIVASYTVSSIPPVSETPTGGNYQTFAQQIVNQPTNVITINGSAVTLPTSPRKYFLGVVVDPEGTLDQLSLPHNSLELIHVVGPPLRHLPAAGVVSTPNDAQFPYAPGNEPIGPRFDVHARADAHTDTDAHADADSNADADPDTNTDSDTNANSDTNADSHPDTYTHANTYAHPNTSYANAHTHTDTFVHEHVMD